MHLARRGELLGDLEAGVAAAHDQHRPVGQIVRRAVGAAVELDDVRVEALGDRRDDGHLERPGRDDDLVGLVGAVVELDEVAAARARRTDWTRLSSSTGSSKRRA